MTPRPWFRLDPDFLRRVLPRVSRTRAHLGHFAPQGAPDGAELVRRGLAAQFHLAAGRLLASPSMSAIFASRERRFLRAWTAGFPKESGFPAFVARPKSKAGRDLLRKLAAEETHPQTAAIFFYAGDRKTALKLLKTSPDAGAGLLADCAHLRAAYLDDLRGARKLLSTASGRVESTYDAIAVAEAWSSVLEDRAAAARVLEGARRLARQRGGLCRLAWGWGAILGDVDRARALLREAESVPPGQPDEPTCARDWRFLLGDDAAARETLEALESRAKGVEDWRFAAQEWWTVFGDRARASAAAAKGAEAAAGPRDRLLIAETYGMIRDKAGARALLDRAEKAATSGGDFSWIAETRASVLRDRAGARAALARALEIEENPYSAETYVEGAVKKLGARAVRPIYDRIARRVKTFHDHLVAARIYDLHLPDPKSHGRHLSAAAGLARDPADQRDLAKYLRESGKDLERADLLIERALAAAKDVDTWICLTTYKPGDPSAFFRRHWPNALAMVRPGDWARLIDHAASYQDPALSRLVLEALEKAGAAGSDWLRAAEEWRELGEPDRQIACVERAAAADALPLDLADAWTKAGRPEKAAAALPDLESAAAEDVLALGRCAQSWHAAGHPDRARACLERATAAARQPHEHSACGTLWRTLFDDRARAEACEARSGAPPGSLDVRLPGFFAGIQSASMDVAEHPFLPSVVGF